MSRFLLFFSLLLLPFSVHADNGQLLLRLDSALSAKPEAKKQKMHNIGLLRSSLAKAPDDDRALRVYDDLYTEYHVYSYDSAAYYLKRGLALARKDNDTYYIHLFSIRKVELLSIAGLYSEAERLAKAIDCNRLEPSLRFSYYIALFDLYRNLAEYCYDDDYSPSYRAFAYSCLQRSMKYLPQDKGIRYYYLGDLAKLVKHDLTLARYYYKKAVAFTGEETRIHAMSCYVLAQNYKNSFGKRGEKLYEEYLIKAATSDAKCLIMDNLALQKLAILFYKRGQGDIKRAQRYILEALSDAKLYNSRLRILEVSHNLPTIINHYQGAMNRQNYDLKITIIVISVLVVVLFVFLSLFYVQNKKLAYSHLRQREATRQLKISYENQEQLNVKLTKLNEQLADTNRKRDELSKLFIDLCDKFISRLAKYQTLVIRKIRAGQVQQLLSLSNSSRLSEEDSEVFYHKFDKAFLALYPTFVEEFNALLRDDAKLMPKQEGSLTNDMRVYALIRLGVKESSEISNLLFYSPRTVYNYRSQMKNRAVDRDTFEDDVRRLCTVMGKC